MIIFAFFAILLPIFQGILGAPDTDRFSFSDRRETDDSKYDRYNRRGSNSGSGSGIENVFKIPIAAIQGTSAAAQAFSPQNSQTIQSIFDIPVTTLDAVGNYIKDSRPQRIGNNIDYNDVNTKTQKPLSLNDERRQERRERLLMLREQERERRKIIDQERIFNLGHHSNFNIFSTLAELLIGGGGYNTGNLFGGHSQGHVHGHGHQGKPPKRPSKPSKPGNHGSHGSFGNFPAGNGNYEVYEQVDDEPTKYSGIFSWLQMATNSQADDDEIQNKIAPGYEFNYDRERPEPRFL